MQKLNAQVLRIYPLLSYDSSRRIHHESKSSSETRFTVADVSSMKNAYSVVQNSDIMAKRNKKPTVRRQDRLGLTKLKIGKSNKGLKMEEQIDKTRSFTTGNNILNEQTVISDHRDSNVMDGSSSREQDLVQSSSSPADYTRTQERSVAVETLPKSDSEVTLSDLLIDLNDIKMEMIPPQTTENTIIVSPNISDIPQVSKLTTEKDNLLIEPKNDLSLPGTSRGEALRPPIFTGGSQMELENEVVAETYEPIEDPHDKIFRVKKKVKKRYKNRPPNLKQRANIAVRNLQLYL